ncbi:hypothetical protein [Mucilaginibacter sp. 22184]|uniref:hypothetical protein n=1 Tax=Mucilaginibacter sp. 22184 TaxID=3453887 RepID=UPI003F82FF94
MIKYTRSVIYLVGILLLASCAGRDTQIAENTFIHGHKIYKVIDNELREIGDLAARDIKKFEVSKPKQRDLGVSTLSFVKPGASTSLKALYRGNFLYYNLRVSELNDLRENYSLNGTLTIQFIDEFGFILHSTQIPVMELVGVVNDNNKVEYLMYNGKTEMSTEINAAIKTYSVAASVKRKSLYGF